MRRPRSPQPEEGEPKPTVQFLGVGGYACTLLSDEGPPAGTQVAVRITKDENVEDHINRHYRLTQVLTWGVPKLVGKVDRYANVASIPYHYLAAMRAHSHGAYKLKEWSEDEDNETPITVYRMEYANRGTFASYAWRTLPKGYHLSDGKRFTFLALGLLYAAGWRLGFQHSDLTPKNLLVYQDAHGEIWPWIIDFDKATLGSPRETGSTYVMPPEAALPPQGGEVLCSYDVWSLGMCLLGKLLKDASAAKHVEVVYYLRSGIVDDVPNQPELDDETYDRLWGYLGTCCMHSLLTGTTIDSYSLQTNERPLFTALSNADLHAIRKRMHKAAREQYGEAVGNIAKDQLALLRRMLHLDPRERVFQGDMFRYFDEPYFNTLKDKSVLLSKMILPILGIASMPNLLVRPIQDRLRALVEAGIMPPCGQCSRLAYYVDMQLEGYVCEACAPTV